MISRGGGDADLAGLMSGDLLDVEVTVPNSWSGVMFSAAAIDCRKAA